MKLPKLQVYQKLMKNETKQFTAHYKRIENSYAWTVSKLLSISPMSFYSVHACQIIEGGVLKER